MRVETPENRALLEQDKAFANGTNGRHRVELVDAVHGAQPSARAQTIETCPLSPNQAGLWHIQQVAPNSIGYNTKFTARIISELDVAALQRACARLVDRHAALRTTFAVEDGVPMMQVHPSLPLSFQVIDVSTWTEDQVHTRAKEELHKRINLLDGPAIRFFVFRRSPTNSVFMFSMHHILQDLTSCAVLIEDIGALYESELTGQPSKLPELRAQYPDFVKWQTDILSSESGKRAEQYWHEVFQSVPGYLDMPADRPRPAVPTYNGSVHHFWVDEKLNASLNRVAGQTGLKPFEILFSSFQLLLHRFSREEIFFVGTLMSGRSLLKFVPMAGYFTNVVPIRSDFSGNPTFVEYVRRASAALRGAHEHRNYPFALMARQHASRAEAGGSAHVRAVFGLQTTERLKKFGVYDLANFGDPSLSRLTLGGLTIEPWALTHQDGNFDLQLWMADVGGAIAAEFKYATDLFDAARVEQFAESFLVLLEDIVQHPEKRIEQFSLISAKRREQMLVEWNDTREAEDPRCFHQIFEEQASRTPDAVAVTFANDAVTYRELDERSNQLAHHLIELGAKPGALVGLYVERSPAMLVGLLGILKTGAAYVPMDPIYPRERLRWMLEDAQPIAVVTEARLIETLPAEGLELVRVDLDAEKNRLAMRAKTKPEVTIAPHELAYVIFTSGSTGRPKGVELMHRGLTSFLKTMASKPGIQREDALLAVTTLSFDIAALELFLPLTVGARVVIASREQSLDGKALVRLIEQSNATIMQATPVTWRLMIAAGWTGTKNLKVLCGGEAFPNDLARELLRLAGSVWNMYGPTETTIWSLVYEIKEASEAGVMPIGRPIGNTTVYILDAEKQVVPVGVNGDLYIGGAGVARGYRLRPELTAEKFIADPFLNTPGERIYKTGDVARYHTDGNVEFLGRSDNQIKLRGFRIELQEIEAVISEHPGVRQAAVVVREDQGDKRLVAYVVPKQGDVPEDLRESARKRLPEYMVPVAFVKIDELPLTPNGKVDRRALSLRKDELAPRVAGFTAPRDPVEVKLARLFESVLGITGVGVAQSFFDLGGHSMLALTLADRIEKAFGKSLPIAAIFSSPSVAELAELLRGEGTASKWRALEPLQPEGKKPPLFFVGSLPAANNLIPYLGKDQPVYGLNFWSLVGGAEDVPDLSVNKIARAYLEEIVAMQPKGPYRLGAYCDDALIAQEIAMVLSDRGEKVSFLGFIDGFRHIRQYRAYDPKAFYRTAREFGAGYVLLRMKRRMAIIERGMEILRSKVLVKSKEIVDRKLSITYHHRLLHEAYLRALAEHKPRYYQGRVTVFASRELSLRFPTLCETVIASDIETIELPGYHDRMFSQPLVDLLGASFRDKLAAAE